MAVRRGGGVATSIHVDKIGAVTHLCLAENFCRNPPPTLYYQLGSGIGEEAQ